MDTKIDITPYKDAIISAEKAIANASENLHYSEYREACEEVLSGLYFSLENLGISDRTLLTIAADFVDVIAYHNPLAFAA